MHKRVSKIRPLSQLRCFQRSEEGTFTLEAVIWMPIFVILLAIIMNLSMVFFHESQMLRVVQDTTRAYSMFKIKTPEGLTEEEYAEAYIRDQLSYLNLSDNELYIKVETINTTDGWSYGQAIVSTTANNLMPFELMSGPFANFQVGVSTRFVMEI